VTSAGRPTGTSDVTVVVDVGPGTVDVDVAVDVVTDVVVAVVVDVTVLT
jgi:hypothetical protein